MCIMRGCNARGRGGAARIYTPRSRLDAAVISARPESQLRRAGLGAQRGGRSVGEVGLDEVGGQADMRPRGLGSLLLPRAMWGLLVAPLRGVMVTDCPLLDAA